MDIKSISNNIDFDKISDQVNQKSNKDFKKILEDAKNSKDDKKLKKACKDFESIFVNILLKNMRKTVGNSSAVEKSHGRKIYESMLDEKIASKVSEGEGIGIADTLYDSLKQQKNTFDLKG